MKYFLRPYTKFGVSVLLVAGVFGFSAVGQGLQIGQLVEHSSPLFLRTPSQSYLGVDLGDVDLERALHFKDASGRELRGAEITVLDHDAPAGKVGLKLHDVIVQMNGTAIDSADQLKKMLHQTPPGRKIQLVVNRDGVQQTLTVQLADHRKLQEAARRQIGSTDSGSAPTQSFLSGSDSPSTGGGFHLWGMGSSLKVGALVEPLTAQMSDFLGIGGGLMIKSVAHKSAADAAGLKAHDVILQVGGEGVATTSDWERLIRSSEGKPVQVAIMRDRTKQLILLQVDGTRH